MSLLSANSSGSCNSILVTDISTYPLSGYPQTEVAKALFWSTDSFVTVDSYSFANPSTSWTISGTNNQIYTFYLFTAIYFESTTPTIWGSNEICFYTNNFYINTSSGNIDNSIPFNPAEWELLDIGGTYADGDALYAEFYGVYVTAGSSLIDYTTVTFQVQCPSLDITKVACHQFRITNNTGGYTFSGISLESYDGTILDSSFSFVSNEFTINLDDYMDGGDGVYIVRLPFTYGSIVDELETVIVDFCDARECWNDLFKYIMCKCSDPCDEGCLDDNDIMTKYNDMLLLFGLIGEIEAKVYVETFQYMGIYTIDDTRQSMITEIGSMIDKIKLITDRCGMCSEDDNLTVEC